MKIIKTANYKKVAQQEYINKINEYARMELGRDLNPSESDSVLRNLNNLGTSWGEEHLIYELEKLKTRNG